MAAAAGPGTAAAATFLPITNPPPTHQQQQPSHWHRKQDSLLQTRLMSHPLPSEVLVPLLLRLQPLPLLLAVRMLKRRMLRPLQQQRLAEKRADRPIEEVAYVERGGPFGRSVSGSKPPVGALGSASALRTTTGSYPRSLSLISRPRSRKHAI